MKSTREYTRKPSTFYHDIFLISNLQWVLEKKKKNPPTDNAEEAEVEQFYEDVQDLTPKEMSFSS